ncbi:MAG: hypothetical protein SFY32_00065 [Bacteroidota bacterium]|nr:hypothetical protein [Bacteroidota bacterium]
MSRQDMVWDTLTGYFYDGIPTGNGLQGMLLHRQDKNRGDGNTNTLLFEINRSDVIDSCQMQQEGYSWERKAIGKFAFTPKGNMLKNTFRLNLWDAEATGNIVTDKGEIKIKFYTHATQQVQVIDYEWSGNESEPSIKFLADNAGCMLDFVTVDFQEKAEYASAEEAILKQENDIFTYHQKLNANREFTLGWTFRKEKNKITLFHTLAYSHPVSAPKFTVEEVLNKSVIQHSTFKTQHSIWWHNFYQQTAFISLNDPKYENFYWAQVYKMGCTMRENLQMMDLNGPWYAHTPWRGIWWNWNTQATYYPLSKINHPELVKPLIKSLFDNEKSLALNLAPELRNQDAIGIGRASSYDLRSNINMNDGPPLYTGREPGNLTWIMQVCYENLKSIGDDETLKGKYFSLLKRSVNLYLALIEKKSDGKYHLPMTMSPEYKPAEDCNYDLAILNWGLNTLLNINQKYKLNDPLADKWMEVKINLTGYPTGQYGFKIGKDVDLLESHRHFSHLMMIYPLKNINPKIKENKKIIEQSLTHWLTVPGNGLAAWSNIVAGGIYTSIQDGNAAKGMLDKSFSAFSANTMYREAGQCAETPYMWVKVFTDMLANNKQDTIEVFPAIPYQWSDISFDKLRIEGAFLVSATLENAKITKIKIMSEKGGRVIFHKKDGVKIVNQQNVKKIVENANYFTFDFDMGGIVQFSIHNILPDFLKEILTEDAKYNMFGKKTNKL